jgi:CheY-like chemotaxis protein
MQLLDREITQSTALVVDPNPTARSVMAAQLRDLGVQQVRQLSRVQDARLLLEETTFDIVLCELDFEGGTTSGQELIDELRQEHLLPYWTVFILVTAQATYAQVVDAAEATVDGYLLKPYSASALADRLAEARHRKRVLDPAYRALQEGHMIEAAIFCERVADERGRYATYAAQVAGELWLKIEQCERAAEVYERVLETQSLPWARAGVARARLLMGEVGRARRLLEELIEDQPGYADAHDLIARLLLEQGELDDALEAFQRATRLTPGCILRLQHTGTLGFYLGMKGDALYFLDKALGMGRKSKLFDGLTLAVVAMLRYDLQDYKGLAAAQRQIADMRAGFPMSARLRMMDLCGQTLMLLAAQRPDDALGMAQELGDEALLESFDLESAALTLSLWARIPNSERPPKAWDNLLRTVGLRFATSKAATEVLVGAAGMGDKETELLRDAQHSITTLAKQALSRSMANKPREAVESLIVHGQQTRNARLIDMAANLLRRYAPAMEDSRTLNDAVVSLQRRWCRPLTHIAGIRRTTRTPGGVVLRK